MSPVLWSQIFSVHTTQRKNYEQKSKIIDNNYAMFEHMVNNYGLSIYLFLLILIYKIIFLTSFYCTRTTVD